MFDLLLFGSLLLNCTGNAVLYFLYYSMSSRKYGTGTGLCGSSHVTMMATMSLLLKV